MSRPHGSGVGLLCSGAVLLSAFCGSGCTAIIARSKIAGAESALHEAEQAGAKAKAQYRYTLALLYLEKAREEEAFSRLGVATELGAKAESFALDAHREANGEIPAVPIVPLNGEPAAIPPGAPSTTEPAPAPAPGTAAPAPMPAPAIPNPSFDVAPAPAPAPVPPAIPNPSFEPDLTPKPAPVPAPAPAPVPAPKPKPAPVPAAPIDPNAPLPPIPFPDEELPPTP